MITSMSAAYWPAALTTTRLELGPVQPADVPTFVRLWTDRDVRRYLGGPVSDDVVRVRREKCVGAVGLFSVVRREDGAVLGSVWVEPESRGGRTEVSYQLAPEYWGCGYAREAVAAVVAWALAEVPAAVPGIVAVTQAANDTSRRLLEALGATQIDSFVEWDAPQVLYLFAGSGAPPRGGQLT
ncbi:GNAT family N-acetyltransferase [Streptomyces sp. NPDC058475]|uniref:GNAT family N-acetyltransferase n=1 Tax=unclassified Streptomyces TaxID=2593676 RepID=UPI00364DDEDE